LEARKVEEFESKMGNKYLIERTLEEIAEKLMTVEQVEEVKEEEVKEVVSVAPSGLGVANAGSK
jgi:hypothetical protein